MVERIHFVDRLKGLAMLAVVIGHISFFTFKEDPSLVSLIVGSFEMPVFMFLSGFVIPSPPSFKKTVVKWCSFLCPFIFVGMLFRYIFYGEVGELFFNNIKSGYWYLYTLACFYFFLLLFRWNSRKEGKWAFFIDVMLALSVFAGIIFLKKTCENTVSAGLLSTHQLSSYWPWFIGGHIARKYNFIGVLSKQPWIYSISLVLYLIFAAVYSSGHYGFFMLSALFAIPTFVFVFLSRENKTSGVENYLELVGKKSLDIYIFHFFFTSMTDLSFLGSWFASTRNFFLEFLLSLILAIIIASCCIIIGNIFKLSPLFRDVVYGDFIKRIIKL